MTQIIAGTKTEFAIDPDILNLLPAQGSVELQHDAAARLVDRRRNPGMLADRGFPHHGAISTKSTGVVGRHATGYDQSGATSSAACEEPGLSVVTILRLLKAGVHRAHEDAIRKRDAS